MGTKKMNGRILLLDAAHEAFAFRPYDSVGISQILTQAGVQAPTLYHHFKDKELLYVSWATRKLEGIRAQVEPLASPAIPLESALVAIAELLSKIDFDPRLIMLESKNFSEANRIDLFSAHHAALSDPIFAVLARFQGTLRSPVGQLTKLFVTVALDLRQVCQGTPDPATYAKWWTTTFLQGAIHPNT